MLDFIDGTVTLINNRDIDRESIEEFWITVEARDNLGTGNSNSTLLHVQILDVNGNSRRRWRKFALQIKRLISFSQTTLQFFYSQITWHWCAPI